MVNTFPILKRYDCVLIQKDMILKTRVTVGVYRVHKVMYIVIDNINNNIVAQQGFLIVIEKFLPGNLIHIKK